MSALLELAAILKKRKGIVPSEVLDSPSTPPADAPKIARRKGGRRRYSPGRLYAFQLESQVRAANRRADKAEAALAAIEKVNAKVWRLNQTIARLRGRRNRPGQLDAALQRIAELEEQLRNTPNGETA